MIARVARVINADVDDISSLADLISVTIRSQLLKAPELRSVLFGIGAGTSKPFIVVGCGARY